MYLTLFIFTSIAIQVIKVQSVECGIKTINECVCVPGATENENCDTLQNEMNEASSGLLAGKIVCDPDNSVCTLSCGDSSLGALDPCTIVGAAAGATAICEEVDATLKVCRFDATNAAIPINPSNCIPADLSPDCKSSNENCDKLTDTLSCVLAAMGSADVVTTFACDPVTKMCTLSCENDESCSSGPDIAIEGFDIDLTGAKCEEIAVDGESSKICRLPTTTGTVTLATPSELGLVCTTDPSDMSNLLQCKCVSATDDCLRILNTYKYQMDQTLTSELASKASFVCDETQPLCTLSVSCTTESDEKTCASAASLVSITTQTEVTLTCGETGNCERVVGAGSEITPNAATSSTKSAIGAVVNDGGGTEENGASTAIDCSFIRADRAPEECFKGYKPGDGCAIEVHFTAIVCNVPDQMSVGTLSGVIHDAFDVLVEELDEDVVCEEDEIEVYPLKVEQTGGDAGDANDRGDPVEGCPTIADLCDVDHVEFTMEAKVELRCGEFIECEDLYDWAKKLLDAVHDGSFADNFGDLAEELSATADEVCDLGLGTVEVQSPVTVQLVNEDGVLYEKEVVLHRGAAVYQRYLGAIAVVMAVLSFVC